jgi:hypothetical protein
LARERERHLFIFFDLIFALQIRLGNVREQHRLSALKYIFENVDREVNLENAAG